MRLAWLILLCSCWATGLLCGEDTVKVTGTIFLRYNGDTGDGGPLLPKTIAKGEKYSLRYPLSDSPSPEGKEFEPEMLLEFTPTVGFMPWVAGQVITVAGKLKVTQLDESNAKPGLSGTNKERPITDEFRYIVKVFPGKEYTMRFRSKNKQYDSVTITWKFEVITK